MVCQIYSQIIWEKIYINRDRNRERWRDTKRHKELTTQRVIKDMFMIIKSDSVKSRKSLYCIGKFSVNSSKFPHKIPSKNEKKET